MAFMIPTRQRKGIWRLAHYTTKCEPDTSIGVMCIFRQRGGSKGSASSRNLHLQPSFTMNTLLCR